MTKAEEFLCSCGMNTDAIDPLKLSESMCQCYSKGLSAEDNIVPMIPTYLINTGEIDHDKQVIVIDAGGTNFRSALVSFNDAGVQVSSLYKQKMPGIAYPVPWEDFIRFIADSIEPLLPFSDRIGFCFSYTADITPEIDGKVVRIDKEVKITGCEGKLLSKSLLSELEGRGYKNKKAIILNDTVAVLLGGSALCNREAYEDFIGQVSGTGTNTCCIVKAEKLTKIQYASASAMILNMESGMFNDIPRGLFDLEVDRLSANPGSKLLEKMTAGVYLGQLCRRILINASENGYISESVRTDLDNIALIDSSVIDSWAQGNISSELKVNDEDKEFIAYVSRSLIERSARIMCSNILAIMKLNGTGLNPCKPVCVLAEGSLVQRSQIYRPYYHKLITEFLAEKAGRYAELRLCGESTLAGSAAAALLNIN